jgi:hypothetical protein
MTSAVVPLRQPVAMRKRTPLLSHLERSAYHAAHRLLTERTGNPALAGQGAYRSSEMDDIARIIMEELRKK